MVSPWLCLFNCRATRWLTVGFVSQSPARRFGAAYGDAVSSRGGCVIYRPSWPQASLRSSLRNRASSSSNEVMEVTEGALAVLGLEAVQGSSQDQQQAILRLGKLAALPEHGDAMLRAGVIELLSQAIRNPGVEVEVRVALLTILADLSETAVVAERLVRQEGLLQEACAALQAGGDWGGLARGHATRLLSSLFSPADLHPLLAEAGAIGSLLQHVKDLARDKAVGGESLDVLARGVWARRRWERQEEEASLSRALYGITGSQQGSQALSQDPEVLRQLYVWATSPDPALQHGAVGCVARAVEAVPAEAAGLVAAGGGSGALVAGLSSGEPATACLAAEGVAVLARRGGGAARDLVDNFGLHGALFRMAEAPQRVASGRASRDPRRHFIQAPQQRWWASEAAEAAQLAALRALLACCQERAYLLPRLRLIEAGPNLRLLEAGWGPEPRIPFGQEALALSRQILEEMER